MEIQWKGRYQQLVDAITAYSNNYAANWQKNLYDAGDRTVSAAEMQILALILENDKTQLKMTDISRKIDMPKSSFSRHISQLESKGLVEKLHPADNNKDIIIHSTDIGRRTYMEYSEYIYAHVFKPVFDILDDVPEEHIEKMAAAMQLWRNAASLDVK